LEPWVFEHPVLVLRAMAYAADELAPCIGVFEGFSADLM